MSEYAQFRAPRYQDTRRRGSKVSAELSDEDVDAALALTIVGFDPRDNYPEWSNNGLREAYRAGWEDRGHD